jgi:hypothetical protein
MYHHFRWQILHSKKNKTMKPRSKLALAAALGLAFSTLTANAQFISVNVREQLTFGAFTGGTNNSITNNGVVNATEVVSTGTSAANPFTITYTPILGASNVMLSTGTLNVANFTFTSPTSPVNTFASLPFELKLDFDNNGTFDVIQNYSLTTSRFTAPNGLTGINYAIIPVQFFGSAMFNSQNYGYASVVANGSGTLFDGNSTTSLIQFQFLATPVPEPSTYALFGVVALCGIVAFSRRSQKQASLMA